MSSDNWAAMNNYMDNITSSLDGGRNSVRRTVLNEDMVCSQQSILNVMETFVKTVNKMDETILIPCRLMDQKVGDEQDPAYKQNSKTKHTPSVHPMFHSADLFDIYNMLNGAKDNLLWGQSQDTPILKINSVQPEVKGHFRRPSSVSVASTNSSTSALSDTDSESGGADSGIEELITNEERAQKFADDFRRHLHGLTSSLSQMTEAAQYLTWRYQYDIGGPI